MKKHKKTIKPQAKSKTYFAPHLVASKLQVALASDLGNDYPEEDLTQLYEASDCCDVESRYRAIFSKRMIDDFQKKFTDETSSDRQKSPQARAAVRKFLQNCDRLEDFDPDLPSWTGGSWAERPSIRTLVLARAKSLISDLLGPLDLDHFAMLMKHSNGTTQGLTFQKTNLEDKQRFPITATPQQARLMIIYWKFDPSWVESALTNSAPVWRVLYELDPYSVFDIVTSSEGTTVPKNLDIDRFIAKETTVGMYQQKGAEQALYDALCEGGLSVGLGYWLDLEKLQVEHRYRAQIASVTGSEATIDWSNASDNWLRLVVRWLIPSDWYHLLVTIGSSYIRVRDDSGEWRTRHMPMISTMGNATTFPLETLLFYAIALATVSIRYDTSLTVCPNWADLKGQVSVFGDDCILPTEDSSLFISVMESLGHECNKTKSYVSGWFRESCGGDYYLSRDVRPIYLSWPTATHSKEALEAWLNIIFNRFYEKYIVYFDGQDVLQTEVFRTLSEIYREHDLKVRVVPPEMPDDAGLKIDVQQLMLSSFKSLELLNTLVDEHGTVSFTFLSYKYPDKYCRSDAVRYATWIKTPHCVSDGSLSYLTAPSVVSIRKKCGKRQFVLSRESEDRVPLDNEYLVKRGGRYVVRVSVSSSWDKGRETSIKTQRDCLGLLDSRMFLTATQK